MRITVVSHALRESGAAGFAALLAAVTDACAQGAAVVVLPDMGAAAEAEYAERLRSACPSARVLAAGDTGSPDGIAVTPLGTTAALAGDQCLDVSILRSLAAREPNAVILRPGSESELQAEAMIEFALGLSESASGLVIVADADGAAPGEPGHGGCVIVANGEIVAEGMGGDELVSADLAAVPVPPPDPRDLVPELPPILAQRLAHHRGERQRVSYPADIE